MKNNCYVTNDIIQHYQNADKKTKALIRRDFKEFSNVNVKKLIRSQKIVKEKDFYFYTTRSRGIIMFFIRRNKLPYVCKYFAHQDILEFISKNKNA